MHSQVSRLIDRLTEEAQRGEFESIAQDANDKIQALGSVKSAKADIDSQMISIAGAELAQTIDLIFSEPSFHRIIAGLQPEIEGLPYSLNGLGYNNLVFTAASLGTLRRSAQYSFRSIIVEEPEAHLHPQLQVLLLRHLVKATKVEESEVQVIASTHSPILASQAPIDSIVLIHETGTQVSGVSVCTIEYDPSDKKKLQRFLDATRAELFFARKILMVEGIAEALLIPVLAQIAGGNLKDSAVTVLNTDGLNFNAFLPLFGEGKLGMPVVILTDGDDADRSGTPSATATGLKAKEGEIPNLRVELGEITLEHELARSSEILPYMLQAYEALHPQNGAALKVLINRLTDREAKADAFLAEFKRNRTGKGAYAQELASLIENAELTAESVPEYIRDALMHLNVINSK